ncbi:hypothetical protein PIB30_078941 [Stylosanthes scabra]|uniref:Uncharacterized protein n=1 Tax=Stylosanthes scabra TaxID=79078 RepID=A0ABU6SR45_9FABA|nr:hypothetical protein [Stylosanthes scabra]
MLDEKRHIILRTMGTVEQKYVRRIAYRLLDMLPPLEYKFKLFWLEGDDHVRAMFELHHRYGRRQVTEFLAEMWNVGRSDSGLSSSGSGCVDDGSDEEFLSETDDSSDSFEEAQYVAEMHQVRRVLLPASVAIPNLSDVSSYFHTLAVISTRCTWMLCRRSPEKVLEGA